MWGQNSSPVEKLRRFVPSTVPDQNSLEKMFCQLSRESLVDINSAPQHRLNFMVRSSCSDDDTESIKDVKIDQNIDLDYCLADNYDLENKSLQTPMSEKTCEVENLENSDYLLKDSIHHTDNNTCTPRRV